MTAKYCENYISSKRFRDSGVDGYLKNSGVVFQLYCPMYPERTKSENYKSKINTDLKKLKQAIDNQKWKWATLGWTFVTPEELPVEILNHAHQKTKEILGIENFGSITSSNLAPLFLEYEFIHKDFPELTAGIYFDKVPKIQINFVRNRSFNMIEIFNNGTEDVQDLNIEYKKGTDVFSTWNDFFLYQDDDPAMSRYHTCRNLQKGERQYIGNVKIKGDFKIKVDCVGVESGKTFILEQEIPVISGV